MSSSSPTPHSAPSDDAAPPPAAAAPAPSATSSSSQKRSAAAASASTKPPPKPKGRPPKKPRPPKSTITQTSTAAFSTDATSNTHSHTHWTGSYDTVLAESEALLAAASQAQQLGRLRLASSYLWLLQARLVPLGKRLDAAQQATTSVILKHKTTTTTTTVPDKGTTANEAVSTSSSSTDSTAPAAASSSNVATATMTTIHANTHATAARSPVVAHSRPGLVPILPAPTPFSPKKLVVSVAPPPQVMTTTTSNSSSNNNNNNNNNLDNNNNNGDDNSHDDQRIVGRGRKPDTTPLYTAPHAECDILALVRQGQQQQLDQAQLEHEIQAVVVAATTASRGVTTTQQQPADGKKGMTMSTTSKAMANQSMTKFTKVPETVTLAPVPAPMTMAAWQGLDDEESQNPETFPTAAV